MIYPIHHTFAPHVNTTYVLRTMHVLLRPWLWKKGKSTTDLSTMLSRWFDGDCSLFLNGRDGLLALLRACNAESGSEVIIQGYTCVALPNAIHTAGYTPVFADCDPNTINMDLDSVREKITNRTIAIICQHTFGMATDTEKLRALCDEKKLLLIEDCAHTIPDVSGPKHIGKHADAIMLSFGRDKAASGITGGAIITKNKLLQEGMVLENTRKKHLSLPAVFTLLLYPILYYVSRPVYGISLGKAMLWATGRMGLLHPVLTRKEKRGLQTPMVKHMPNACAFLVVKQLRKFHSLNNHRRVLTNIYMEASKKNNWNIPKGLSVNFALQKFPMYVQNADVIRSQLKKFNVHLDDGWTGAAVCPRTVDQEAAGYTVGSCPKAEKIEHTILCLPTHPTMSKQQAMKLIDILETIIV